MTRGVPNKPARKGPSREKIEAAIAKSRAIMDGTYQAPAPVKATRANPFNQRTRQPKELAVRSKGGSQIGPR